MRFSDYIMDYNNYKKGKINTNFTKELDKYYKQIIRFFSKYNKEKYNEYIATAKDKYNELLLKFHKDITIYKYDNIEKYKVLFYNHSILYSLHINNKISCMQINAFLEEVLVNIHNERLIIKGVISGIYTDLINDFSK